MVSIPLKRYHNWLLFLFFSIFYVLCHSLHQRAYILVLAIFLPSLFFPSHLFTPALRRDSAGLGLFNDPWPAKNSSLPRPSAFRSDQEPVTCLTKSPGYWFTMLRAVSSTQSYSGVFLPFLTICPCPAFPIKIFY